MDSGVTGSPATSSGPSRTSDEGSRGERAHPSFSDLSSIDLARAAELMHSNVSDIDPGMCIKYDDVGLMHPARGMNFVSLHAAKRHLAQVITLTGMTEVHDNGQPTDILFTGAKMEHCTAAINALMHQAWARHIPGVPDVGRAYIVTPQGAANVAFNILEVFNT